MKDGASSGTTTGICCKGSYDGRKPYSHTKSLVPPTRLVRVRVRVRVLQSSGRNKILSGRIIGTRQY